MTLWLDASAVVCLVLREPMSPNVDRTLATATGRIIISDFCLAEASAAISRLVRIGVRSPDGADVLYSEMDAWATEISEHVRITPDDVIEATRFVRRSPLALRAPDAIHIAAAHRLEATLVTLDLGMARAALALGLACINPAESLGEPKD